MKVKYFGLEDGRCLNVGALTPDMQAELVQELASSNTDTVLKQADYKSVKRVK